MTLRPEPYQHLLREEIFHALAAFANEAAARGVGMSALAIAWVLAQPACGRGNHRPAESVTPYAALEGVTIALSSSDARDWERLFGIRNFSERARAGRRFRSAPASAARRRSIR